MPSKGPERDADKDREGRLEELRERLYSRGRELPKQERHQLHDVQSDVTRSWPPPLRPERPRPVPSRPQPPAPMQEETPLSMPRRKKRAYRTVLIAIGAAFFIVALILSATFLFFGRNTISGNNISIGVNGPFAIGGGEMLPLQIAIANQNAVSIESATLIIEYPLGTQSADEPGKELFRERKQIENINSGEVLNIPIRAVVYGEESDERTVLVSVEYRVRGSNATFFKEAEPFNFKISSSPVVISVQGVEKIASGQEMILTLRVSSNSPTTLSNVLIKADGYPQGFDFVGSEPDPVSGRDTWLIPELDPKETQEIEVRGILVGNQDETKVFRFSVGVANERDRLSLASIFTSQSHEVDIERPFLDVQIRINGDTGPEITIAPESEAQVAVTFRNTLSDTIYEGEIAVTLSGNALDDSGIKSTEGFYDSTTDTIRWDARSTNSLAQLQPGDSSTVTFSVSPRARSDAAQTPQVTLSVNVKGRRTSEDRVSQALSGTARRTIKVESSIELGSQALYSVGPFLNTGPMPPRAEEVTTYTVTMGVANGSNAVTDAVVEATVPSYVTWLDLTTFGSRFSYNSVTRAVSWDIGDLASGELKEASFQISLLPSTSQVNQTPTLLGEQRLRATDRFTGTTLRSTSRALTTRLTNDPNPDTRDGQVLPKGGGNN